MTSRPLFISVAESIVILGPICHTGCASASLTEALASSARVQPRKGPPEPVRITRLRSSRRSPRRHSARAACSESTGTSRSGSPLIRSTTRSPPTTRLSLLASASIFPACSAASVGLRPAGPTSALSTMSASTSRARTSAASGPTCTSTPWIPAIFSRRSAAASSSAIATCGGRNSRIWPTRSSWLVPADRPTTLNRSGLCRTTSSACVPTDPVEPRITSERIERKITLSRPQTPYPGVTRGVRVISEQDQPQVDEGGRRHEQHRIDPVHHPAVARQDAAHVLDAQVALDQGLSQVAERREQRHHDRQAHRAPNIVEDVDLGHDPDGHGHRDQGRADRPLPRLLGADGGGKRPAAPEVAHSERGGVVHEREPDDR